MINPGKRLQTYQPGNPPVLVAHADWSTGPGKRWLAIARLCADGRYTASAPQPLSDPSGLLMGMRELAGPVGAVLVGFDFPIGLPEKWAVRAGCSSFLELLPRLGQGVWSDFFHPAERAGEISLLRPFYPSRAGSARHIHLTEALGVSEINDLRRKCDLPHAGRRAASPLFWTLGGQQVGKAAIHGWREVLRPGLDDPGLNMGIWPFSGPLEGMLAAGRLVVAETYPTECYAHLGVSFSKPQRGTKTGKRVQADRAANAGCLSTWAERAGVYLEPSLVAVIKDGFSPAPGGEDPFDTIIGLFGMLNVVLGRQTLFEPGDPAIRNIEGWIFGQSGDAIFSGKIE